MLNTVLGTKDVIMQRQVRLSHVMAHFIVWINTILCIPSLAVVHEAVSTFGILNSASVNIHVQVFCCNTCFNPYGGKPGGGMAGLYSNSGTPDILYVPC